jgi:hypothetical protein
MTTTADQTSAIPDEIDQSSPDLAAILDSLPKLAQSTFYIKPRENLTDGQEAEYKTILLSLPARLRVRTPLQNLCIRYAKLTCTLREMERRVEADGVVAFGSQGQLTRHPLLATIAAYITQLSALTKQLHLGINEDKRTTDTARVKEEAQKSALHTAQSSGGLLATPTIRQN